MNNKENQNKLNRKKMKKMTAFLSSRNYTISKKTVGKKEKNIQNKATFLLREISNHFIDKIREWMS